MKDVTAFLALLRMLSIKAETFRITIQGRPMIGDLVEDCLEIDFCLSAVLLDERVLVIGPVTLALEIPEGKSTSKP